MNTPLHQTRDLTKAIRHKTELLARSTHQLAANSISFKLASRERISVVSESGSGKSTLGQLLLGLTLPTSSGVWFEGMNHKDRNKQNWTKFRVQTALVQQNPLSTRNPQMTIGQQVVEGLLVHRICNHSEAYEHAGTMLEHVGLSHAMMSRYPHRMSGGHCQRVVIDRALILNPKLVIFDKVNLALDILVQAQMVALLRSL